MVEVDTADGHDDEWAPPKVWTLLQRNDVKYGEVYSDDPMFNTIKHKTIQIINDDHETFLSFKIFGIYKMYTKATQEQCS